MKKRLLITSIVMMLVVAVALGTSTYAWFTSNATVKASEITLRAEVNGSSSLGIGWIGEDSTNTSITFANYEVLRPMAPDTLTVGETTSDVLFRSATIKEEGSVEKFNSGVLTSYVAVPAADITVGTTNVSSYYLNDGGVYKQASGTAQSGKTYYTKNFAPVVCRNASGTQEFYVKNVSHTNSIGTITVSAVLLNNNAYVLTKDTTFVEGRTYYTDPEGTPVAHLTVASNPGEGQLTAGVAVTENTYYEIVDANDMIRVAIFTKPATVGANTSAQYTLLGVLGKTATDYDQVTGEYDRNKTYYVKSGDDYTQTAVTAETFGTFKTAGSLYTATDTVAYGAAGKFVENANVKDLDHYQAVATSLTLTSSLAHDQQIDIVAVVWFDGTELTDARAGSLGQVSLKFDA